MRILFKTRVKKNYRQVFQAFDIDLFMKLKAPFTSLIINRFESCKTGDVVDISVNMFGIKNHWISEITEHKITESEAYFIDEGKKLPSPLKIWKHLHKIEKSIDSSIIIDDITYVTTSKIMDFLLFPVIFSMFYYRKPIYKKQFK